MICLSRKNPTYTFKKIVKMKKKKIRTKQYQIFGTLSFSSVFFFFFQDTNVSQRKIEIDEEKK